MKRNKLLHVIALSSMMLAATLTSCGGGGSNTDDDGNETITLKLAVDVSSSEVNIANKLIEGFTSKEENKNIKISVVKITQGYDSYIQKNSATKNGMADLISVYDYNAEYWTSMNIFKDISSYMTRDGINESDYVSSVFQLGKSGQNDNDFYWVPRDYNKVVVCYNTEIFKAAGIEKPTNDWTMDDFNKVCAKLLEKEDEIKAITKKYDFWPAEMNIKWTAVYYPFFKSYGGDVMADDGTLFKNPDIVKSSLKKLLNYSDQKGGKVYDGLGYSNPIGQTGDTSAFINKQAAMTFTVRPNVYSYANALNNNIDFVSLPKITDNNGNTSYIGSGCSGYAITSKVDDTKAEAAWKFLKYIISSEGQEVLGETGSGVPVLKSLIDDKDSAWRNFISSDLNHDAFTAFEERDLTMNYVHEFPIDQQLKVYKELKDNFIYSLYNTDDRDKEFDTFKSYVDKTILGK